MVQLTRACDHEVLVQCLSEVLDEYARMIWETRKNIVAMRDGDCNIVRRMGKCVDDTDSTIGTFRLLSLHNDALSSSAGSHGCTREQVLQSSRTLSELLLHRNKVGTFIKSYYLLQYACTDEGRDLITQYRQCLMNVRSTLFHFRHHCNFYNRRASAKRHYLLQHIWRTSSPRRADISRTMLPHARSSSSVSTNTKERWWACVHKRPPPSSCARAFSLPCRCVYDMSCDNETFSFLCSKSIRSKQHIARLSIAKSIKT